MHCLVIDHWSRSNRTGSSRRAAPAGPDGTFRVFGHLASRSLNRSTTAGRSWTTRALGGVSKRHDAAYRSGVCRDRVKVKMAARREPNRERSRLFDRSKAGALL